MIQYNILSFIGQQSVTVIHVLLRFLLFALVSQLKQFSESRSDVIILELCQVFFVAMTLLYNPSASRNQTATPLPIGTAFPSTATGPTIYHTSSYPTINPIPVSIRGTVSCGSFIQDILSSGEQHYYLFRNSNDDDLNLNISTCPMGCNSEFDTDLYIFDTDLKELDYVDGGCPGTGSRAFISQTWSKQTYIIMLNDFYNSSTGQYYIEFLCDGYTHRPTPHTVSPTTYDPTASTPSNQCNSESNSSICITNRSLWMYHR